MLIATMAFQAHAGENDKQYRNGLLSHFTLNNAHFLKTVGFLSLGSLCLYICSKLLKAKQPEKAKRENLNPTKKAADDVEEVPTVTIAAAVHADPKADLFHRFANDTSKARTENVDEQKPAQHQVEPIQEPSSTSYYDNFEYSNLD